MSDSPAMQLTGEGDVRCLERLLADYYGVRFAVAMSSATMGLLAVGLALDLRRSDFITTPLTYGASLSGWLLLGNRPHFADVEVGGVVLDPDEVRRAITSRTRAILAVDLLGYPAATEALSNLAREYGLFLVVDSAQGFGARRDGRPAGYGADAIVVSFTSGKALDVGEGGAVVTDDAEIYQRVVWWTQHPLRQKRDLGLELINELALNGRIHPAAARDARMQWGDALARCAARRDVAEQQLRQLNDRGAIELRRSDIGEPSYLRALAIPRSGRSLDQAARMLDIELQPLPVSYLPDAPAFRAQCRGRSRNCPGARTMLSTAVCFSPSTGGAPQSAERSELHRSRQR